MPKTRAPKDQVESYNNDGVTCFKSDTPNSEQPYHFRQGKSYETYEEFKDCSRGKATEVR